MSPPRRAHPNLGPHTPWSDSEGANGSGIYCLQLPSGAEAQYKLDATGTNFAIRTRIQKTRLPPRYPTQDPQSSH
eukprot:CAMPEP_0180285498 /NCGR_PEP_ID=MMETSP0988-20121125/11946_1 /TAXON_ID=697907 /ORGANISM="non described non described, Strain CCMP2293" /LENGTH=74 /DNA_ID=CAMNT_0022258911 /DNA_START=55 /DNA_END=279 /DNA_ORIENTATION=-